MSRILTVGAAQMGPIPRKDSRRATVERLIALLHQAHAKGCQLVVFTEAALTAFFPHWFMDDQDEIDSFFETSMPNEATQPLFDEAKRLGVGFCLGYAELVIENGKKRRFNTAILVERDGSIVGKYRKIHLPGYGADSYNANYNWQNLEKYYFEVGNLGFPVWQTFGGNLGLCICNDRRWPETYRVLGLQDVELVMLGYNTPHEGLKGPEEPGHLPMFHNQLSMQAGAYQNSTWVVGVAKAGTEEGVYQIGGTCIINPMGEIVALANTEQDELIVADCDLDMGKRLKEATFNFAKHRRIEHYGPIAAQTGRTPPGGEEG